MNVNELIPNRINGLEVIYTDADVITADNVVSIVNDAIDIHNRNKRKIQHLWNIYKGKQKIYQRTKEKASRDDICNKVCENHAYEIVQFKTGQSYGEPIQYISRKDDDFINNAVDELNDYMTDADKHAKNVKAGEWQSATGTAFQAVQITNDDIIPYRIICPSPLNTFIVYSSETEEPMLSVQILEDVNGNDYYKCYSKNMEFNITGGELVASRLHVFGDVPIVEYPNNWERISDIGLVEDLLNAINAYQSNRLDSVEQFVSSWIKFVNCEVDSEQFEKMKMSGALVVKSNNGSEHKADVDVITQELNQSETQIAKDDLWNNILTILAIPNKQSNTGGDSQGAVELRNGWDFSKSRAKLKDTVIKVSEKRLVKIVLNILRISGNDLKISARDFDVQINHSPTDNMVIKCQSLQYLLQCGIHPLIAIKTVGLWGDAEKTFLVSEPYLDNLWKTIDDAEIEKQTEDAINLLKNANKEVGN